MSGNYDAEILDTFRKILGASELETKELPIHRIQVGMVFAEDVKMRTSALFVSRGFHVTEGFVACVQNFQPGTIVEPVRVIALK